MTCVFFCSYTTFSSVQLLSHVQLFATPWTAARQASLSITNSWSLLKLMSIESVMPSNHLILRHPLLLLPSIFPSIRVFSNESALHIRWPKYLSCSFNISPSNDYSELISFRIDWFDLLAVWGTFKSLLQHHSSKASIFQCLAFFMAQLSHPYRAKANRVLPRECTGQSKHPLPRSYQVSLTRFHGCWRIHKLCQRWQTFYSKHEKEPVHTFPLIPQPTPPSQLMREK